MKNNKSTQKQGSHALFLSTITSAILSVCVLVGVVVFAIMKVRSNKQHNEKWKDYDECGIS